MPPIARTIDDITADFDEIAELSDSGAGGGRYDTFLLSLVPQRSVRVLDVGCGLGWLTWAIAREGREVIGIDLSSRMLERARTTRPSDRVTFHQGDFLTFDFAGGSFDCIVSAGALHHMPCDVAVPRMVNLLEPGGRLIIHDLKRNVGLLESVRAYGALAAIAAGRMAKTGRPLPDRLVREAWARHGAKETYLSFHEAQALAERSLPGATVVNHWLWRYTIVWDKPLAR